MASSAAPPLLPEDLLRQLFPWHLWVNDDGLIVEVGHQLGAFFIKQAADVIGQPASAMLKVELGRWVAMFRGGSLDMQHHNEHHTQDLSDCGINDGWDIAAAMGKPCILQTMVPHRAGGGVVQLKGAWQRGQRGDPAQAAWFFSGQVYALGMEDMEAAGLDLEDLPAGDLSADLCSAYIEHKHDVAKMTKHVLELENLLVDRSCASDADEFDVDGAQQMDNTLYRVIIPHRTSASGTEQGAELMSGFLQQSVQPELTANRRDVEVEQSMMELVLGRHAIAPKFPRQEASEMLSSKLSAGDPIADLDISMPFNPTRNNAALLTIVSTHEDEDFLLATGGTGTAMDVAGGDCAVSTVRAHVQADAQDTPSLHPRRPASSLLARMFRCFAGAGEAANVADMPFTKAPVDEPDIADSVRQTAEHKQVDVLDGLTPVPDAASAPTSVAPAQHSAGLSCTSKQSPAADAKLVSESQVLAFETVLSDPVAAVLAHVDDWVFDSFELATVTNNRPLSTLAFYLFKHTGITSALLLDERKLSRFLLRIEQGYNDNPYHNRTHAADVLRTLYAITTRGGLLKIMSQSTSSKQDKSEENIFVTDQCMPTPSSELSISDALCLLAVFLSAIVHDYDHKGLTNAFLIQDEHPLALLYNDMSPMENHHISAAMSILYNEDTNFLSHLSRSVRDTFRLHVIQMVLGTDMKQHFSTLGLFNSKMDEVAKSAEVPHEVVRTSAVSGSRRQPMTPRPQPGVNLGRPSASKAQRRPDAPAAAGAAPAHDRPSAQPASGGEALPKKLADISMDDELQMLVWKMALKCADLGHLATAECVHKSWVRALEEEMFRQGDLEKARGYPISPLMDRSKAGITKSQPTFFDAIVLPLYSSFAAALPGIEPLLKQVRSNRAMWVDMGNKDSGPQLNSS